MADDITQDQTQTTPEQPPTNPVDTSTNQTEPKPETTTQNPSPSETPQPEQIPTETQPSVFPPVLNIPVLHYPFSGNFPLTFSFGQQSDNEEIKKKFQEWGIVGHNGLDFGLTAGNEVFACDSGKVIQSGDNGDFGISITIQHSWGQSIYAHLQETKVKDGEDIGVNKVIGLSGSSGAAFGEHLHFAIKPNNPDESNGYLGFIDPSRYLSLPSQKEEPKQETTETPPVEEQKTPEETKPPETTQPPQEQPKPEETQQPLAEKVPPPIKLEPEKPAEQPQVFIDPTQMQEQVDEKLKAELDTRRIKANQERQTRREENLMKIGKLIVEKKQINNDDVRELLHVSQSTATNYLQTLVDRGTIKKEGKGKTTTYHY
ncbi:MAG: Peptidase M23 family protein [Microgenomates group bacterium GW2011_GWA1_48_10]|nr:MAG: Peptidase M23 family protein [Microgenomates group bacterium GW2011_GWA1_48_10]